jgi:succinate-semialdehyde dehydrogenase/glutarate-semialdehyde dehydrogenase
VHESIAERFLAAFVAATRALKLGRGLDWSYDVGSLVSEKQFGTVSKQVADAMKKGARVECGGRPRPDLGPFFWEPTILSGVESGMTLYDEETFGPVVSVYPFASNNEAIERANDTRYGLNASIWSKNVDLARRMATRLRCGTVTINETYAVGWGSVDAPMGGFKDSGLGRRHGAEGILKYTESQNVTVQHGPALAPPKSVPPEAFAKGLNSALRAMKKLPGL